MWSSSLTLSQGILISACVMLAGCTGLPAAKIWHDPLTSDEHALLAQTYASRGERTAAVREYEAILKTDPRHVPALVALGNIAVEQKDWSTAEAHYRRALQLDPHHVSANNNLATVYLLTDKDLETAERLTLRALQQPSDQRAFINETLASIYVKQQRWPEADAAVKEAESEGEAYPPELRARLAELRQQIAAHRQPAL